MERSDPEPKAPFLFFYYLRTYLGAILLTNEPTSLRSSNCSIKTPSTSVIRLFSSAISSAILTMHSSSCESFHSRSFMRVRRVVWLRVGISLLATKEKKRAQLIGVLPN